MSHTLVITVRFHEGRYHGVGDGPPSPARLFQALVAGCGLSGPLNLHDSEALKWLEGLEPPIVACPVMVNGQWFRNYLPNNDLDAKGGDARRIAEIRTWKSIRPRLCDAEIPLLYAWAFDDDEKSQYYAQAVCALSERLYQLGRGVDMAWACGETLDVAELERRLSSYPGLAYRPSKGGTGETLACPTPGSLESLKERYRANSRRFKTEGQGTAARQLFSQPPKPRFAQVAYESPPTRCLYELRRDAAESSFSVWPLARASTLVVWLRDTAAERLRRALPDRRQDIERVLIGRKADGADAGPTSLRVRIIPLPSVGHYYADRAIRRVLVEVPAGCPLRAEDIQWAFSGVELADPETGESLDLVLIPSADDSMLAHYGVTDRVRSRVWRTVTPAALPEAARRRRIDPVHVAAQAKDGAERAEEQARAAGAVLQALRHAEVRTGVEVIRVQKEPFDARGERVEAFAPGTRFAKERLWHVEIVFSSPVAGPVLLGDGRFLGLGVMAPVRTTQGVLAFAVEDGLAAMAEPLDVTKALRRAVMARVQDVLGADVGLPSFFSGHADESWAGATDSPPHLTFVFDPVSPRLLIVAPHVIERRAPTAEEVRYLGNLQIALKGFQELRAGPAGRLTLRAALVDAGVDPLFGASRIWESVTPYQVTRHAKHVGAAEALCADLLAECRRRGLPEPATTPLEPHGVPGVGLVGGARLVFKTAVQGPILLGRSRFLGGGLFSQAASLSK